MRSAIILRSSDALLCFVCAIVASFPSGKRRLILYSDGGLVSAPLSPIIFMIKLYHTRAKKSIKKVFLYLFLFLRGFFPRATAFAANFSRDSASTPLCTFSFSAKEKVRKRTLRQVAVRRLRCRCSCGKPQQADMSPKGICSSSRNTLNSANIHPFTVV